MAGLGLGSIEDLSKEIRGRLAEPRRGLGSLGTRAQLDREMSHQPPPSSGRDVIRSLGPVGQGLAVLPQVPLHIAKTIAQEAIGFPARWRTLADAAARGDDKAGAEAAFNVALDITPAGLASRVPTTAGAGTVLRSGLGRSSRPEVPSAPYDAAGGYGANGRPPLVSNQRISTRQPSPAAVAKGADDPATNSLQIDTAAMIDGGVMDKAIAKMIQEPGMDFLKDLPSIEAAEKLTKFKENNLEFIMERLSPEFRDRSKLWYVGANRFARELAERYGIEDASVAGAIAALSPKRDWFQNAGLAERVAEVALGPASRKWDDGMTKVAEFRGLDADILKRVKGKSYGEMNTLEEKALWVRAWSEANRDPNYRSITPEGDIGDFVLTGKGEKQKIAWATSAQIEKAIKSFESGGDLSVIGPEMGQQHKVRSFFNNILDPYNPAGDVTVDTHAISAAMLSPLGVNDDPTKLGLGLLAPSSAVTGSKGTYGIHADAVRNVGEKLGFLPRETQSMTWEAVRGLFANKSPEMKKQAVAIWRDFGSGKITQRQAQERITELAGGFSDPKWLSEARPERSIGRGGSTMYGMGAGAGGGLGMYLLDRELAKEDDT